MLEIPTERNAPPRTSYAAVSKDDSDAAHALDEAVVIGWTEFLTGNSVLSLPTALFRKMPMNDQYPKFIGGVDSYFCRVLTETGGRLAYIENGPVARHNDWPYSESKIEVYRTLIDQPATRDLYYLRWKIRNLLRRFRG